jgi:lipoic acid synthetase
MLTLGQYLQPTAASARAALRASGRVRDVRARSVCDGLRHAAVGALVRSSYHADRQAEEVLQEL